MNPTVLYYHQIEQQLSEELHRALVSPVALLLGPDAAEPLHQRITAMVPTLVRQLHDLDDEHLAGDTAADVMAALYPVNSAPEPEWWHTLLGRLIARSMGAGDDSVSYSVAAAMLGVSKTRVQQLVEGGKLDRHPDGGVLRSSVMQRLANFPGGGFVEFDRR